MNDITNRYQIVETTYSFDLNFSYQIILSRPILRIPFNSHPSKEINLRISYM